VIVELDQPPPVVFPEPPAPRGNHVRFRLSPEVLIALGARRKRPGEEMVGEPIELSFVEQPAQGRDGRLGDYERLLGEAMEGDPTLFARQDLVEVSWAIVEPVLEAGPGKLLTYEPGTWGPPEADALPAPAGGWSRGA
jgi:glucose-6-phosphate 1-dehydrogenase